MSQQIVRSEDFRTPPGIHQIQRMLYRGEGSPIGQKSSPNIGAIYVDYIGGNLWICTVINNVNGWKPFYSQNISAATIDTDVQEGDFVGIFGPGTWANASANINTARDYCASGGSEISAWLAGGKTAVAALSSTETFNGSTWAMSANSLLTAPATPGTGELYAIDGGGSQTAAWARGGKTFAGTDGYTFMQIFNGDTWTVGANGKSTAFNYYAVTGGTLYSAFYGSSGNNYEYYNGDSWIKFSGSLPANVGNNAARGIGSSNSFFVCGGLDSAIGSIRYSGTAHFNGYSYIAGSNLNFSRSSHQIAGNSLNSIISGGSDSVGASFTAYSSSEFFNGCTWGNGNSLSISVRAAAANSGSRNQMIVTAGSTNGTTKLNSTEIHTQSIYRKLNFANAMGAMKIGIATNVVNSSYTANIMSGDIVTHRIPYKKYFGFDKFIHYPSTYFLESTRTVSSIVANVDGTATVILGTSNTEITKGMLLNINGSATTANNGTFPVVNFSGGTSVTIKNPNAVNQGASGNAALVWGNRIVGLPTTTITYTAPNVIFTFDLTGTISANTFAKLAIINSVIYVPYVATSGSNGSQYNFGSYVVNSISSNTITCSAIHSQHVTETIACTTIEILNHTLAKSITETDDYILGFNGRMNLLNNLSNDSNFTKW